MSCILLVEDNPHIMNINFSALVMCNYDVLCAKNLGEAQKYISSQKIDLIVLDVMLPDGDGISWCRELKKDYSIPILFLSALSSNNDIISGLRSGGDDYLSKPYDLDVFIARVETRLRSSSSTKALVLGPLKINTVSSVAFLFGKDMLLTNKEYLVLRYLAKHSEEIVDAQLMYSEIWGTSNSSDKNAIYTVISRLKKKLEHEKSNITITAIRNLGYRLEML